MERAIKYLEDGELPSRQASDTPFWRKHLPRWAVATALISTGGLVAAATIDAGAWSGLWHSVVVSIFDLARTARHLVGG